MFNQMWACLFFTPTQLETDADVEKPTNKRKLKAYLNIERFVAAEIVFESNSFTDCARRTWRFGFLRYDDLNALPIYTQHLLFVILQQSNSKWI